MRRIRDARSRGAKLVVIDPRCHQLAKEADLWIPVRPGSDGALILALITLIINKKWYDSEFVLRWTAGFEELADYAALFTLKVAESICGIDAASIEQLAGIISRASGVAADFYSGLEFSACGVQSTRALFSLLALTGNIDADGGLYIHDYPHKPYDEYCIDRHNPPIGAREYPLFYALTGMAHIAGLPDAVLRNDPYPVRGLLLAGGSPYLSYPDSATWMRTYEELDFLAVIDRFMSEETAWADVILPAATYYEISSYHTYRNHIRLRDQVIEPIGQAMNDSLILSAIAQRLGYGDAFPKSEKEIRDRALRNYPELFESCHDNGGVVVLPRAERRVHKFASGHLRSDQGPGFPTPSGKFEFASTLLKCYGYDPLPVYAEPYPSDTENSLPLMLTTGARTRARFNSQYLDRPELAERNQAVLEINPCDAEMRGIRGGDSVFLKTSQGRLALQAVVTPAICAGAVHLPSGGGGARQVGSWRDLHVNSIIPADAKDPISGYPVLKAVRCQVVTFNEMEHSDSAEVSAASIGISQDCPQCGNDYR